MKTSDSSHMTPLTTSLLLKQHYLKTVSRFWHKTLCISYFCQFKLQIHTHAHERCCSDTDLRFVTELHAGLRRGGPGYLMSLGTMPVDLMAWPCSPWANGGAGRGPGGHNWERRSHGRLRELCWKHTLTASALCFGCEGGRASEFYTRCDIGAHTHTRSSTLQHRLRLKH